MKLPIFLDNHSTTPMDPRVLDAMLPYFVEKFGNSASRNHAFGWEAEEAVDRGREQLAKLIGAKSKEIVFTSGATESNNLAIKGAAHFYKPKGKHLVTVKTEHKATLDTMRELERQGVTMAESQRRTKEREFSELNREFQRRQREFREDLNQRRNEELANLLGCDPDDILHVSAKDLGTGKEQKITITASTNLNMADIERMVNEAKKNEGEDRKRKDLVAQAHAHHGPAAVGEQAAHLSDQRAEVLRVAGPVADQHAVCVVEEHQ